MRNKKRLIGPGVFVAASLLAGCGGGGSSTPTPVSGPSAEGAYKGTITNSATASAFNAVVLEDGQYWTLYGNSAGGVLVVNGLIQGQGTSTNGTFTSSTLKDFGYSPAVSGTLNATYAAGASISGTVVLGAGSIGLTGTAVPTATFDYNTAASVSNVVGAWTLSSTSGQTIALNIASGGSFTGLVSNGCSLTGTVSPRPSGKNILNVQLTFGPAPCSLPGQQAVGIGIYTTLVTGAHQLIVAVTDSTRTYASTSFGTR